MMNKESVYPNIISAMVFPVLAGVITALGITIMGIVISAALIHNCSIGEDRAAFVSIIVWFGASAFGVLIAGQTAKDHKLISMCFVAVVYIVILACLKAIIFSEPYSTIGKGIGIIFSGIVPSMFISYLRKRDKIPKFKYRA